MLIDYWDKNTNLNAAWVSICLVVVVIINMFGAGAYGESLAPLVYVCTMLNTVQARPSSFSAP